jgi:hypothetical protein
MSKITSIYLDIFTNSNKNNKNIEAYNGALNLNISNVDTPLSTRDTRNASFDSGRINVHGNI